MKNYIDLDNKNNYFTILLLSYFNVKLSYYDKERH